MSLAQSFEAVALKPLTGRHTSRDTFLRCFNSEHYSVCVHQMLCYAQKQDKVSNVNYLGTISYLPLLGSFQF